MQTPQRNRDRFADSRRYDTQCVCQICTCGRHHCPATSHKPFEGQTTHNHDYKPYTIDTSDRNRPVSHHYQQRHYDKDYLKSNYQMSYVPHQVQANCPLTNQGYEYKPRSGQFYDETEYKKNYQNKQFVFQPQRQCSHNYVPNRTKFEGKSTYNAQFSPKKGEPAYQPTPYQYQKNNTPFQGKSTYQSEFQQHQFEPASKGPCVSYQKNSTRFQGQSHYKADYKPYQVQYQEHCPVMDLPHRPRENSPGKTHLNYSAEKNGWY